MNAKELASTYEPLWAAVPETRPTDGDWSLWMRGLDDHDGPWLAWARGATGGHSEGVDDTSAAALCRVAAEDFLPTVDWICSFAIWPAESDGQSVVLSIDPAFTEAKWLRDESGLGVEHDACTIEFDGPTIHHALVRACLAVHASSSPNSAPSPQLPQPPV